MLTLLALVLAAYLALRLVFVEEGQAPGNRGLPLLFVACLLAASALGQVAFRQLSWVPDTAASAVLKQGLADIRVALEDPQVRRVLVVDGGSYPARGLDGQLLARLLSGTDGVPTAVVQLSIPGGNHLERIAMYRDFVGLLGASDLERLNRREVVLMLEVHAGYDHDPLAQYETGKFTDRTYAYLSPSLAWAGFRAWRHFNGEASLVESLRLAGELASHAAVNAFGVGMLHRHERMDQIEAQPGYLPMREVRRDFNFRGLRNVRARSLDGERPPLAPEVERFSRWRVDAVERALGGVQARTVFYALPSSNAVGMTYTQSFCAWTGHACIAIDDGEMVAQLDDARFWFDSGHLMPPGADLYTRWLAGRLAPLLGAGHGEARP